MASQGLGVYSFELHMCGEGYICFGCEARGVKTVSIMPIWFVTHECGISVGQQQNKYLQGLEQKQSIPL